ncbi:hypothetical protein ABDD95_18590 [Mucilaginibacter sp. PAMB04274]|uniref:hypothetical protein n=1 Tax=Mucilaginibacter sp. PAMB04274 TaxID=3138568 RepID=UPI0031F6A942
MKPIDFFRLQAKNLLRDFKTQTIRFDPEFDSDVYEYNPRFFDIDGLFLDFDIDEEDFKLADAQHLMARLAGFRKWADLTKGTASEFELAKLLFDNQHKISAEEWHYYIRGVETDNQLRYDPDFRLDVFQQVFADVEGHQTMYQDYRLNRDVIGKLGDEPPIKEKRHIQTDNIQITTLPLETGIRERFLETAENSFERVLERMEPEQPELIRKLWNPALYIDEILLTEDMLPIDDGYALSLVEAFLVHHVFDLADQAEAAKPSGD